MSKSSRKYEFIELLKKYQQQKASPKEIEFLEQYYQYFDKEEKTSLGLSPEEIKRLEASIFQNIQRMIGTPEKTGWETSHKIFTMRRIAVAAVVLLLLTSGLYTWRKNARQQELAKIRDVSQRFKNDVAPGTDKAVLMLADGSKIALDSAHNGLLSRQGNAKVLKFNAGQLAYQADKNNAGKPDLSTIKYNTVSTPRGGQYQVVLADGSKVWLNAASSLRFPTSFNGREREVELQGEAYFEVAKNPSMPFKVHIPGKKGTRAGNGIDVRVLGTHFNINAYDDEPLVKTTLLEGAVKIVSGENVTYLNPGNQAQVDELGDMKFISNANVEEAVAWKNGLFQFRSADIETIMRQVARWYDVDIEYEKKVDEKFYVEISRNINASNVFKILELTDAVHFKIEGRKILVMP